MGTTTIPPVQSLRATERTSPTTVAVVTTTTRKAPQLDTRITIDTTDAGWFVLAFLVVVLAALAYRSRGQRSRYNATQARPSSPGIETRAQYVGEVRHNGYYAGAA